jgi:alpha-galactosidase
LGNYYPLLSTPKDQSVWVAWQYDRADIGEGMVMAFRRQASPYRKASLELKGIDIKARYEVEWVDRKKKQVLSGKELKVLEVEISEKEQSVLVVYRKLK